MCRVCVSCRKQGSLHLGGLLQDQAPPVTCQPCHVGRLTASSGTVSPRQQGRCHETMEVVLTPQRSQRGRLSTLQELRQRIRHLSYGHGRAVIKLKQDAEAALHAAAEAESRQRLEDYQEKAALRRLGREQVCVQPAKLRLGVLRRGCIPQGISAAGVRQR